MAGEWGEQSACLGVCLEEGSLSCLSLRLFKHIFLQVENLVFQNPVVFQIPSIWEYMCT